MNDKINIIDFNNDPLIVSTKEFEKIAALMSLRSQNTKKTKK